MGWGIYVIGAVLCWGMYGPALHAGQKALGDPQTGAGGGIRALLWVGFAYFLIAVLVPVGALASQNTPGQFTAKGSGIATLAGALGALGAVCIIYAFMNKGTPAVVMPLVFGGAPLVNVLVSMALHPPKQSPSPLLYLGFILAALGGFMVLKFKPI